MPLPGEGYHKDGRNLRLRKYIRQKIDMLTDEFYLRLTEAEEDHFYDLHSHDEVDKYAHDLLVKKIVKEKTLWIFCTENP